MGLVALGMDNRLSNSWYRVASLKPVLRAHTGIHRHTFRGQRWYVVRDNATGKHHRITPEAQLIVSLMDGTRSVDEIWGIASERLGDDNLTQDDVIRLLTQLHQADVLKSDASPDLREMMQRADRQARRKLLQSVMNPLAVRLPLLDPDRFLTATMPLVRPLFSWFGVVLFLAVVAAASVLAGLHWSALTTDIADRVLAAESLLLLLLTYPLVKALHELGHGYATKVRGGEVHEIGVMFLVFIPVPYVDATAASSFRSKWHRALVGSAGMLVEVFLAALAMFVWVSVEPGLVKAFAFNVMVIGGISTVLFNGNPLLRFDGYYVLSDLIEIPNLGPRSNRYIGYLVQRHLFGVERAVSPVVAPGEAGWFLFYGIAAFLYRIAITLTIILFVASEFPVVGVLLGTWAAVMMFFLPLAKAIGFLFTSLILREHRRRALGVTAGFVMLVVGALTLLPVPFATVSEGVVWAGQDTVVHASINGVVDELLVAPNSSVEKGQAILRMHDPLLPAKVNVARARVTELRARYAALQVLDRAEARVVAEQIRHAEAELALTRERTREMTLRSPVAGRFLVARPADLPGRFLRQGDPIGYVADLQSPTVRVVVPQDAIDLVRVGTERVQVRFAERFDDVRMARVTREIPFVTDQLPSPALSSQGGGDIAVDPTDAAGATALSMLYQLDITPLDPVDAAGVGSRAYVRFDHGSRSIAHQLYREIRQLFLKRFDV